MLGVKAALASTNPPFEKFALSLITLKVNDGVQKVIAEFPCGKTPSNSPIIPHIQVTYGKRESEGSCLLCQMGLPEIYHS